MIEKLYWSKLIYKYNAKTNVVCYRGATTPIHQCPHKQTLFLRFTHLKLKDRARVYTLHSGNHYFFIFVPPSPRLIHDGLRVQLDMLKVEPISRVLDGPGYYSPPIHFRWAQNGQHVLEEEEEVACCVVAFLNPSFTKSLYVSRERAFP